MKYTIELEEETLRKLAALTEKKYSDVIRSDMALKSTLKDYINLQYHSIEMEEIKYVVGWVNDDLDRNNKGEITGFYEASYHKNFNDAINQAREDFTDYYAHISKNREIIVTYGADVGNADVYKPLWSSRDDYECQTARIELEAKKIKQELYDEYKSEETWKGCDYNSFEEFLHSEYQNPEWVKSHLTAEQAVKLYQADDDFLLFYELDGYVWKDNKTVITKGKLPGQLKQFEIIDVTKTSKKKEEFERE